jgi:hypothetical protein
MLLRSTLLACAAVAIVSTAALAQTSAPARCDETNFRIYFAPGSAALDRTAIEMIGAAQRNVSTCPYAELHIAVDATNALGARRGGAIMEALDGRAWNVAQVEPRGMRRVSMSASPAYAEVLMTPRVMPETEALATPERETGV